MTDAGHKFKPDCPANYQITVQGYLDKSRADWFDGMVIEPLIHFSSPSPQTLSPYLGSVSQSPSVSLPLVSA